jgi:ABC-type branched-subunit amino acid transport system substrate-binding protein
MKRYGRWVVALVVVGALLLAACTPDSSTKQGASGGSGSAASGLAAGNDTASSTTGISDDAINVAFIGVDFSALAATGLVPQLGDQQKQVQAFVDDINANGGINGRRINLHFKLLDVLNGGADAIQAACIEATQEFKAAVVLLPPAAARDMARCTSVTNKTLTIYATGMDEGLYHESQGRLFTPAGMSIDRQFRGWADQMNQLQYLEGKTVGVVDGDQPQEFLNGVNDALIPELDKLNHKPAQVVTLPCGAATTSCDQYDAAAQKLKDAGVGTVFMTLANTFGTGLVQAAANIGYHPKWLLEGNQTTDTVLNFFTSVKQDLEGSVGMGFAFALPADITPQATQCSKIVSDRSGEVYQPGSDAFGFASVVCDEFRVLLQAGAKVDKAKLDQGTWIAAIEGLGTFRVAVGPAVTLSSTKHDGGDAMYLCDYSAEAGKCVRRPGDPVRLD